MAQLGPWFRVSYKVLEGQGCGHLQMAIIYMAIGRAQVITGYWPDISIPPQVGLSLREPTNVGWLLLNGRVRENNQDRSHSPFYNLRSDIPLQLDTNKSTHTQGEDIMQVIN